MTAVTIHDEESALGRVLRDSGRLKDLGYPFMSDEVIGPSLGTGIPMPVVRTHPYRFLGLLKGSETLVDHQWREQAACSRHTLEGSNPFLPSGDLLWYFSISTNIVAAFIPLKHREDLGGLGGANAIACLVHIEDVFDQVLPSAIPATQRPLKIMSTYFGPFKPSAFILSFPFDLLGASGMRTRGYLWL